MLPYHYPLLFYISTTLLKFLSYFWSFPSFYKDFKIYFILNGVSGSILTSQTFPKHSANTSDYSRVNGHVKPMEITEEFKRMLFLPWLAVMLHNGIQRKTSYHWWMVWRWRTALWPVLTVWVYRDLIISAATWNVTPYIKINEIKWWIYQGKHSLSSWCISETMSFEAKRHLDLYSRLCTHVIPLNLLVVSGSCESLCRHPREQFQHQAEKMRRDSSNDNCVSFVLLLNVIWEAGSRFETHLSLATYWNVGPLLTLWVILFLWRYSICYWRLD